MRFTRRRRVVERARAGTTPRESRDACRAEIRDAETCWIGSRPSSGGGGLWRREARERRFRREGLNHGRSLLHVTCRMPRRIRGREHTPEFGWIEDFSSQGRSVTPGFSRIEFFFSMPRLCSHGAAAGCLRDCSDSKVEPIANVAVLLRTLRPVASASTLRRERQGRRGVREARASPLRDLSRRRRTGSRPTAVSRARPSRARGS